ncbi:MAG: phage minor head protein, partial [Anaerolineae bacterium]
MPGIYDIVEQHRQQLLRRERQAASEMVQAYGEAWKRIKQRLDDLGQQIQQAKALGEGEISPSWLFQYGRLQSLQSQVEAEIREFAHFAETHIIAQQAEAVQAAQQHAQQLVLAGLGELPPGVTITWARLPQEALADLVGFLSDGSPLRTLLDQLGPEASRAVRDALIAGVALGQNPRRIARQIRAALGGNLARALTISRTEVLRAYREASRRSYQANSDVVKGWVWHSALGPRTCPACWAMHGTVHSLEERLDDHPNGRCAMVPLTRTWQELGFEGVPETPLEIESGASIFARLSEEQQRAILGNAAFEAYKAGTVELSDFVGQSR